MKNDYKILADVGDEHGGGYYHIATANSLKLAMMIINMIKPYFGNEISYVFEMLGTKDMDDLEFKGLRLDKNNKEIDSFY